MNADVEALLDCYERAEEADEALQEFFPELERVVNDEILENLKKVLDQVQYIQNIVTKAVGGPDALVRLQYERDPERDD